MIERSPHSNVNFIRQYFITGPLVYKDKNGISTIIGITSFGPSSGCGKSFYPDYFARVTSAVPWITEVLMQTEKRLPIPWQPKQIIHTKTSKRATEQHSIEISSTFTREHTIKQHYTASSKYKTPIFNKGLCCVISLFIFHKY